MQKTAKKEPAASANATSSKVSKDTTSNNKDNTKVTVCQEVDYGRKYKNCLDTISSIEIALDKLMLALATVINDYDFDDPIYSGAYSGAACMSKAVLSDESLLNGFKWLSGFDKVMGFLNIAADYAEEIQKEVKGCGD